MYKTIKLLNTWKENGYVVKIKQTHRSWEQQSGYFNKGNAQKKILKSKHILKGNFTTGSQEHFFLEGQVAFVIPKSAKISRIPVS